MKKKNEIISIVITSLVLTISLIVLIYKIIAFIEISNRNNLIFLNEKENSHTFLESSKVVEAILEKEAEFLEKNPIVYWPSLEEAELYTNIPFVEAPANILSYNQESYASVGTDIIQVTYKSPEGDYLVLRKSFYDPYKTYSDLSGDFSEYMYSSIFCEGYEEYMFQGNIKHYATIAYWDEMHQYNEDDRCSFSISSSISIKEGLMLSFCEIVHAENEKVMKQFTDCTFSSMRDLFENKDVYYSEENKEYQSIIKAYENYFTKEELNNLAIKSNEKFGKARFSVTYLNNIPSILLSFDSSHLCGVHVFTFDNEKKEVVNLGEFSSFGSILLSEKEDDGIMASFYGNQGNYTVCVTEINEKSECVLKDVFLDQNGLCFYVDYIPKDMILDGSRNDGWFESLIIESTDEYAVGKCEDELEAKYGSMNRIDYDDMYTIWSLYLLD